MVDLHPDIVAAIRNMADTKLGRRYDKFARRRYGVSGAKLAGKTVAGEFGGRSTKTGRGVVSSAGARGPAQFIASTRDAYVQRYNVDPWADDKQAVKGMMLHHLSTGVEGYNPGMPTYKDYILDQRLNKDDRQALKGASPGPSGPTAGGASLRLPGPKSTSVDLQSRTIPGQSFAAERQDVKRQLLLSGDISLKNLLDYKSKLSSLQDVPDRTVRDLKVRHSQGPGVNVKTKDPAAGGGGSRTGGKGGIYEVFYDPLNKYWDSGGVQSGAIGGHGDHVHLSADGTYILRAARYAKELGLRVGENAAFGGVAPVHAEGSYHYQNDKVRGRTVSKGLDVSGDAGAMRKFAKTMMGEARRGRGR